MNYLITREPNSDYIEHHGVLGMKWGHKRTKYTSAYEQAKRNFKDEKKYRNAGHIENPNAAKNAYKSEKRKRKATLNKETTKMWLHDVVSKSGLTYSRGTYSKAAKNMIDKGMSKNEALRKAKVEAWRNTGIAAVAGLTYSNRDKLINVARKYANTRSIQKANSSLARIGTMKLVKVAGDVYEYRMK